MTTDSPSPTLPDPGADGPAREPEDQMAKWIKLPLDEWRRPELWRLPDDASMWQWLRLLCEGTETKPPGRWESRRHAEGVLPGETFAMLDAFVEAGLMVREGEAYVVPNPEAYYPTGDPDSPAAIRKRRQRERDAERDGGRDTKRDDHRDESVSRASYSSSSDVDVDGEHVAREPDPVAWLARNVWSPSPLQITKVERLVETLGADVVMERLLKLQAAGDMPPADINRWVWALEDRFRVSLPSLADPPKREPEPRPYVPPGHRAPWPGSCERQPWHDGACRPATH